MLKLKKMFQIFLVCDIYAKKGGGNTIVEIETGFTPPDHAMDTIDYFSARIMSKIARYSNHCSKFSLATLLQWIFYLFQKFSCYLQMLEKKKMSTNQRSL